MFTVFTLRLVNKDMVNFTRKKSFVLLLKTIPIINLV